jgi:hypothetical protein
MHIKETVEIKERKKIFLGGKLWPVRSADNLTAIYVPIV